ncbi:cytokine receptor family member B12 [Triplophysa dalaica]|uniref:cytokine receptor family member B12 n=1 Tax=Triplophysa dalaica TaxID=1582913 RepID=UPI0024DF7DE5|nr:cytokine receptor family member B12 [Triplophysa dalaica]
MTWFITCSFTFLHIYLVSSKAILFPPMNLTVNLLDFIATAEWIPGPGNPPGTRYTMESIPLQNISGGKWNRSPTCSGIATLKCDRTFDQSEDLHWNYFLRVKTTFKGRSSNWTTISKSFQPYGETRLSSPDVNISTERHKISINFSHRLELNPWTKPLEFLICLFECDSDGLNSKFVAQASASTSPHIFLDVPSGKNYCVNVSASHQKVSQKNNFNATRCFFMSDSPKSHSGVIVFSVAMVAIAVGVILTSIYIYIKMIKNKDRRLPGALLVFAGTKMVLNFCPEKIHVISSMWSNAVTNTENASASEENDSLLYHPRQCTNIIISPSSVIKQEPALHLPDPVEQAESLNRCFSNYILATDLEESEENVISEYDNCNTHLGNAVAFISTSNLSLSSESETPQLHTVRMKLDIDAEEIESWGDEEDDVSFCDDSFSNGGYEPRVNPRVS